MIVLATSVIATPALAAMRAAVPAGSQHFAARRTAPCRNHRGSSPNACPTARPCGPPESLRPHHPQHPAGWRAFGQFDRAPLPQFEPIDRDQLEPHSSDANGCKTLPLRRSNNRTKKGVSRETPFPFYRSGKRSVLETTRTPTRLPPPRFSLPKLRGWAGRAPCPGRALLPRSP